MVIADLSTSNENALYQLGIRHARRPDATIVIAGKQFKFPFDLMHLSVLSYEHLGTGVDSEEAERLQGKLTETIRRKIDRPEIDSPVYFYLPELLPQTGAPPAAGAPGEVAP